MGEAGAAGRTLPPGRGPGADQRAWRGPGAARSRRRRACPRPAAGGRDRGARRLPPQLVRQPRARGAHQGDRRAPRARPGHLHQRGGAAGDPGVRADLDDRHQCLRDAYRAQLSRDAQEWSRRHRGEGAAPHHAVERRPHDRRGGGAEAHPRHRVWPGCRRRGRPGAGTTARSGQAHYLRHGRDDRQGRARRGRRRQPGRGVPGRRRYRARLAAPHRRRLPAASARDRPGRGGRGRGLAGVDRCRRRAPGRPSERGRLPGAALLRPWRHRAHHHRRERDPRLPEPDPPRRRRGEAQRGAGPPGVRGEGRAPPRAAAGRGRSRGTPDRRVEHDARHPRGVERARPRSPRVRPVRVRRQRTSLRDGNGAAARDATDRRAAGPGTVLVVRAALRRRRAPLRTDLATPGSGGQAGRARSGVPPYGDRGDRAARRRGLHRPRRAHPALGRLPLPGSVVRADCPGDRGLRRPEHRCRSGGGFRAGARADVRAQGRARRARRDREPPRRRPGPPRPAEGAGTTQDRPARRRRSSDAARVLRSRPRLAGDAHPRPHGPRHTARRPVHHRGVRRHLRGAPWRPGRAGRLRQHHDRAGPGDLSGEEIVDGDGAPRSDRLRAVQEHAPVDRRRDGPDHPAHRVLRRAQGQMDYSTAFCDGAGRTVTQGLTLPAHLSSFPDALAATIGRFADRMHPGDVYCLNDPFEGGIHIPDVFVLKPIFHEGKRLAFAATICHQTDMGGPVAGSNASDSTEIYQEGLRIPPVKMYDRGEPNETLFRLIEKNVRLPVRVFGDLRAQLAACHIAEAAFLRLVARQGAKRVKVYMEEILDYTERLTRAALRQLPDGEWSFEDWIDDDGVDYGKPIRLFVTLRKTVDRLVADWTGTSPQVKGAINNTLSFTKAATFTCLKSVLSHDVLCNAGFYRPIEVIAPPGTIANGVLPAASAARGLTGFRMIDACFGALARMLPERTIASSEGGNTGVSIGGYYPDRRPFIFVEFICSAWGGRAWSDGLDGNANLMANMSMPPVEITEAEQPLRVLRTEFIQDVGGAGKYRGGASIRRDYEMLEEEAVLQVRSDRHDFRPYGLYGGSPGQPSQNVMNPGTENRQLPGKFTMIMKRGDVFRHDQPGPGGWGDPLERAPDRVLRDVRNELVSLRSARDDYGVVIDSRTWTVDGTATAALRAELRARRGWQEVPVVSR